MLNKFFTAVGEYMILLGKSLQTPQKMRVFWKLFMREIHALGVIHLGLVIFTSIFVGAVVPFRCSIIWCIFISNPAFIRWLCNKQLFWYWNSLRPLSAWFWQEKWGSIDCVKYRNNEGFGANWCTGYHGSTLSQRPDIAQILGLDDRLIHDWLPLVSYLVSAEVIWQGCLTRKLDGIRLYYRDTDVYALIYLSTMPLQTPRYLPVSWRQCLSYFGYFVKGGSLEVGRASTQAVVWTMGLQYPFRASLTPTNIKLMIEVTDLKRVCDGRWSTYRNFNHCETGKVNLISGQSGSGKRFSWQVYWMYTHLLQCEILFDGRDINVMNREATSIYDLRSEPFSRDVPWFDSCTVEETIMFPLDMFTTLTFREKQRRVLKWLEGYIR